MPHFSPCSLNLLHFHVGSQITNIRMVRPGAAQICCWNLAAWPAGASFRLLTAHAWGGCKQFLIVIFLLLRCRRSRR